MQGIRNRFPNTYPLDSVIQRFEQLCIFICSKKSVLIGKTVQLPQDWLCIVVLSSTV